MQAVTAESTSSCLSLLSPSPPFCFRMIYFQEEEFIVLFFFPKGDSFYLIKFFFLLDLLV